MMSVDWVLFRDTDSGTKNKPRLWGFSWRQTAFLGTAMREEWPLSEEEVAEGREVWDVAISFPPRPSLKATIV